MDKITSLFILLTGWIVAGGAFNVGIELPDSYHEVLAGENIWFTTKVINLENKERMDIILTYDILDESRQTVASKTETVAVETQASFVSSLRTPSSLPEGMYYLKVILNSTSGSNIAETTFNIIKEPTLVQYILKFSLFDIFVEIPDSYKTIVPGSELLTSIKLINVGSAGRVDVFLDYTITDTEGNIVLKKRETVAVETQANFIRTFDIPKETPEGTYHISAKITYADGKFAESENMFTVKGAPSTDYTFAFVAGAVVILVGIIIYGASRFSPDFKTWKVRMEVRRIVSKRFNKGR